LRRNCVQDAPADYKPYAPTTVNKDGGATKYAQGGSIRRRIDLSCLLHELRHRIVHSVSVMAGSREHTNSSNTWRSCEPAQARVTRRDEIQPNKTIRIGRRVFMQYLGSPAFLFRGHRITR